MDVHSLQQYLQSRFTGRDDFMQNIIEPIFGNYPFEEGWDTEMLEDDDLLTLAKQTGVTSVVHYGFIELPRNATHIFEVTVADRIQMNRNRVGMQRLVRRLMSGQNQQSAFMIFHYADQWQLDWRFSYCHYGDKEMTTAKRYTFLLGPGQACRTAAQNFFWLFEHRSELTPDDITTAFDVEALSKEFFLKYKEHYDHFCEYVYNNKGNSELFGKEFKQWEDKTIRDYVKKLLGRIVFLHFLQKKGWMGVPADKPWGEGDHQFMKSLFENATDKQKANYLDEVLEPLFSDALDVDRKANNDLFDCGVEGFRNVKIPYLNGGLFERDKMDEPKSVFSRELFADFFNFLYQYNFTIDENDPNDAEVGVDPEMLGRIFENLLEDNKDKGAFYTPKEIVQYMCKESLIAYLTTASIESGNKNPREKVESAIRELVNNPHEIVPRMNQKQKDLFGNALRKVRICDPAIGSGAFPMGLLNELVRCRTAIDAWATDTDGHLLDGDYAALKREIVCNNIYGVDIEQGAIDIARLRFWLSIVVDEREPETLPNLDYKFMKGNSLITTFDGEYVNLDTKGQQHVNIRAMVAEKRTLHGLKQQYYKATGEDKHRLCIQIKDTILRLVSRQIGYEMRSWVQKNATENSLNLDDAVSVSFQTIKQALPTDKLRIIDLAESLHKHLNDSSISLAERALTDIHFFDWRIMFTEVFEGEKPGFDIVIGNPPYISAPAQIANATLSAQRDNIINCKKFSSLYQKWDLYIPFIEHGIQLLCDGGVTTMIVPYPLTNQTYGKKLRELIMSDYTLIELCDLNGTKIFENATVSNCIPFVRKERATAGSTTVISHINENRQIVHAFSKSPTDLVPDAKTAVWNVGEEKRDANRHAGMHVLGDYCYISVGMVVNADEKTAKGEFQKEDLISLTQDEIHCRAYIEAKDIEKYRVKRVRYLEYNTERCPNKLRRPTFRELYEQPKLMVNRLGQLQVYYDNDKLLTSDAMFCCVLWLSLKHVDNKSISASVKRYSTLKRAEMEDLSGEVKLKYLLGILNSSYADVLLTNLRGGDYHIYPEHIRNIPIAPASEAQQLQIITLVDRILSAKKLNPQADTSALEAEIDLLVYDLYGLTEEEIKIIEETSLK